MADYSDLKLTNLGLDLLAKVQAGTTDLTFARFGMGNGSFYFPGDVPTMAALVNEKMTRPVLNTAKLDQISCEVSTIIATADLPVAGFDMSEIGLFAVDPDVGEILYGVIYAGATADHIPASATGMAYDYVINLIVTVSDADQVTIVIDSATAATKEELSNHATLVVDPATTGTDKKHVTGTQAKKWEDHGKNTSNPHGVDKTDVGLSSLPNAKSDLTTLASSVTLATSKAVKTVNDSLTTHATLVVDPATTGTVKAHVTGTQAKKWEDHGENAEIHLTGPMGPIVKEELNAQSDLPIYACRTWANFSSTCVLRSSGNVSSVSDLGVGRYRVNFTKPMPDINYTAVIGGCRSTSWATSGGNRIFTISNFLTTSVVLGCFLSQTAPVAADASIVNLAIFTD